MGNSLRDQLLKAGLVNDDQVRAAESDKRKRRKTQPKPKGQRARQGPSEAQRLQAERANRDRELNKRLEAEREHKARRAQARELIERHQLNDPAGEIPHNFVVGKRIKRLYVNAEQHGLLAEGRLGIANSRGRYYLVAPEVAEKVRALTPEAIVDLSVGSQSSDADDAYAEFPVPDDLTW